MSQVKRFTIAAPAVRWPHRRFQPWTESTTTQRRVDARVTVVIGAFLFVYFLLNALPQKSFIGDDTDQIIFSQRFDLGYHEQPPLYSWLVWLTLHGMGVSHAAYAAVKTAILGALLVAYARVGSMVIDDRRAAALVAFCPVLIPVFFWNAIAYLTHTNLACLFIVLAFGALVSLERNGRIRDYVALGATVGLGVLSKYNAPVIAAALIGAALTLRPFRVRLLDKRVLLSLAVAAIIVAPHLWWLHEHWDAVMHSGAWKAKITTKSSPLLQAGRGVVQLLLNLALSLLPLLAAFGFIFPRALVRARSEDGKRSPALDLLGRCFAAALVLALVLILGARTSHVHERWLQPLTLLVPFYLFGRLGPIAADRVRVATFAGVMAIFAIVATCCYAAQAIGNFHRYGEYVQSLSFQAAAAGINAVIEPEAVLIAEDRVVCANLRYLMPERRHICVPHGAFEPPVAANVPCYVVWNVAHGKRQPPPLAKAYAGRTLNRHIPPSEVPRFVDVHDRATAAPTAKLAYARLVPRN